MATKLDTLDLIASDVAEEVKELQDRLAEIQSTLSQKEQFLDELHERRKKYTRASANGRHKEEVEVEDEKATDQYLGVTKRMIEIVSGVLREDGGAMRANDIVAELERKGEPNPSLQKYYMAVHTTLKRNSGEGDTFEKIGRGLYRLRRKS